MPRRTTAAAGYPHSGWDDAPAAGWHRNDGPKNDYTEQRAWPATVVVSALSDDGIALTLENAQEDDAAFNFGWSPSASSTKPLHVKWNDLGLRDSPALQGRPPSAATLCWRLHCVGGEARVGDFSAGPRNQWSLRASDGSGPPPSFQFRTGVAEIQLFVPRGARLQAAIGVHATSKRPKVVRLGVAGQLCINVEHRDQPHGLRCLCPEALEEVERTIASRMNVRDVSFRPNPGLPDSSAGMDACAMYAKAWRAPVELEAAASAVDDGGGRLMFGVWVTWRLQDDGHYHGVFDIGCELRRSHRLKFRSALAGGEWGSSWVCVQRHANRSNSCLPQWAGHGAVVSARLPEEDLDVTAMDDDEFLEAASFNTLRVAFRLAQDASDPSPQEGHHVIELIPKSLSQSCMAAALIELPQAPLAASAVLGLPATDRFATDSEPLPAADVEEMSGWSLNPSQTAAVSCALSRPLALIHGPPGTGKTRTTAVLAMLLARRNLDSGENRAVLFCAPTNRAVDCAAQFVARLCAERAEERLLRRWADGEVCAICLGQRPDAITACKHAFHKVCLSRALSSGSSCPLCRGTLKHEDSGLRVVRVYGADAEKLDFPAPHKNEHSGGEFRRSPPVPEDMRRYALHWRVHGAVEDEIPTPEALVARHAYRDMLDHGTHGKRAPALRREYYAALSAARAAELRRADIIFTTCISCRRGAMQDALSGPTAPRIEQVIIDEAGQATEPETLCPMTLAWTAQSIYLFGDHKQLRPIIKSQQAQAAGLEISLFERLARKHEADPSTSGVPVCLLAQQYRMNPKISAFPSRHFYQSQLLDDESVLERPSGLLCPGTVWVWDVDKMIPEAADSPDLPKGDGEQVRRVRTVESGVGSRAHDLEATCVAELATELAARAGPSNVAVLSWYNAQVALVRRLVDASEGGSLIHVGSIATAQGSEWDYVLLTTARRGAGGSWGLGIVSDPHVLNVALTRARFGLVVFGSVATLRQDTNWAALLEHCSAKDLVVTEKPPVATDAQTADDALRRALKRGTAVSLRNLQAAPELNGLPGVVASDGANENGRWEVDVDVSTLPSNSAPGQEPTRRLSLKAANLTWASTSAPSGGATEGSKTGPMFSGLNALVAADGGFRAREAQGVEFSKMLSLQLKNMEIIENGPVPKNSKQKQGTQRLLPDEPRRGAKVKIQGLQSCPEHNGLLGMVREEPSSTGGGDRRWKIEVSRSFNLSPEANEHTIEVKPGAAGLEVTRTPKPASQAPLYRPGATVLVHGLQSAQQYNGEWAIVKSANANDDGRWEVEVSLQGQKKNLLLKPENLAPEVRT